jgi:outer membrane receptor protein involved in Fe transport
MLISRIALVAMLAAAPTALLAQPAVQPAEGNDSIASDEIVVTAQKVEQRISEVPITVSAVTGATMREIGVSELDELAAYIPGLTIQEQSANNPGFVIRGITSDSGSSQQGARVTLYYNGVDISRSRGAYQDLYDLERVEVVKGPQATLFGTAAAIGAISIISARPEPGFSGALSGGYGNFDRYLASGFFNAAATCSPAASPSPTRSAAAMSATSRAIRPSPTRTRAASTSAT